MSHATVWILEQLAEWGIHATFFIVGQIALTDFKLVKSIREVGMKWPATVGITAGSTS